MRRIMLLVLAISVAFALVLGYELISSVSPAQPEAAPAAECPSPTPALCPVCQAGGVEIGAADAGVMRIELRLPAVDSQKRGSLANLSVESAPGSGRVFVRMDSDNPLMNPETQNSLRTAIDVARRLTADGFADKNIFYSISASSDIVGGKSAGAAMAVATIALMGGNQLRTDAVITGTIEANGSIGQVGEILAKARAVRDAGYSLFLVPLGEATTTQQVEKCEKKQETIEGGAVIQQVCSTTTQPVNITQEAGIMVVEVSDVTQAYALMKK